MSSEYSKAFIKELGQVSYRTSKTDVFSDFVKIYALEMELATVLRSEDINRIKVLHAGLVGQYCEADRKHFNNMSFIVQEALGAKRESFLGPVLEEIGASNKNNGQFLTPASLANMMARVTAHDVEYTPGKVVRVSDHACGAGVTLIAHGEALILDRHVAQSDIFLIGGDIDGRACDITYIELTILGYAARVDHMNALSMQALSPSRYTLGYFMHSMPMRGVR